MLLGIIFILAGILIVVFERLLEVIVASLLIMIGVLLLSVSYRYKKMSKNTDNPYMNFFMRF
jgi:drug/metabolite transporter (DMT)-like permease